MIEGSLEPVASLESSVVDLGTLLKKTVSSPHEITRSKMDQSSLVTLDNCRREGQDDCDVGVLCVFLLFVPQPYVLSPV